MAGAISAFLFFGAVGTGALQIGAQQRSGETRTRTAYCVAGCARTFVQPEVEGSLGTYLQALGASGIGGLLDSSEQPDLFAYVITDDDTSYGRDHVVNNPAAVEATLRKHGVVDYKLVDAKGGVDVENIETFVNSKQCLTEPAVAGKFSFFGLNNEHLARSLNQLAHIQECVGLVNNAEVKSGQQYDAVIITRPDLEYSVPAGGIPSNFLQTVVDGGALHDRDLWFGLPRDVALKLLPSGPKLVDCSPGQMCCGRITKMEELFEYKLGFVVAGSGTCACTQESIPEASVRHWKISGDDYGQSR